MPSRSASSPRESPRARRRSQGRPQPRESARNFHLRFSSLKARSRDARPRAPLPELRASAGKRAAPPRDARGRARRCPHEQRDPPHGGASDSAGLRRSPRRQRSIALRARRCRPRARSAQMRKRSGAGADGSPRAVQEGWPPEREARATRTRLTHRARMDTQPFTNPGRPSRRVRLRRAERSLSRRRHWRSARRPSRYVPTRRRTSRARVRGWMPTSSRNS